MTRSYVERQEKNELERIDYFRTWPDWTCHITKTMKLPHHCTSSLTWERLRLPWTDILMATMNNNIPRTGRKLQFQTLYSKVTFESLLKQSQRRSLSSQRCFFQSLQMIIRRIISIMTTTRDIDIRRITRVT